MSEPTEARKIRDLEISELSSWSDYLDYARRVGEESGIRQTEARRLIQGRPAFIEEFCYVCNGRKQFRVSDGNEELTEGSDPNWRERLECSGCHLNNRKRASFHLFDIFGMPERKSAIYLTEQRGHFYSLLRKRHPNTTGSEYRGTRYGGGEERFARLCGFRWGRIRNETLTALTFEDDRFDFVVCFEVFEHIPDHRRALRESCRCLKKDGKLFFTVPFNPNAQLNMTRACMDADGNVHHILTPEYHRDPQQRGGILAFHNFGWELLDELRAVGFRKATGFFFWSREFAYLGQNNNVFMAEK